MSDRIKAIYEALPDFYTDTIEQEAKYAAIDNEDRLVVSLGAFSIFTLILAAALLPYSTLVRAVFLVASLAVIPALVPYTLISVAAEKRKKEMENVLADALLLISANLKSGLSVEKAFLLSARDEFGPLAEELRETAMEMFGGKPVAQALDDMEERVKSELFKETLKLLVDGLESGGNTAQLLESSAEDIRNSLELREEIAANIRMYTIFIMMAAMIGAPLLFSISVHMSETTANMWKDVNLQKMSSASSGFGMDFQKPNVNVDFLEEFSLMSIIAINFFASLIISEIKNANVKEGVKYIPILVTISVIIFFIIRSTIGGLVGGFV